MTEAAQVVDVGPGALGPGPHEDVTFADTVEDGSGGARARSLGVTRRSQPHDMRRAGEGPAAPHDDLKIDVVVPRRVDGRGEVVQPVVRATEVGEEGVVSVAAVHLLAREADSGSQVTDGDAVEPGPRVGAEGVLPRKRGGQAQNCREIREYCQSKPRVTSEKFSPIFTTQWCTSEFKHDVGGKRHL